ncbi:hypothetical protein C7W93_05605 [Glaciimonas sp. PCH181]|nr:hypothetical protein C7W93_05605 [Glaciimonas sp. PCH181]
MPPKRKSIKTKICRSPVQAAFALTVATLAVAARAMQKHLSDAGFAARIQGGERPAAHSLGISRMPMLSADIAMT